MNKTIFLRFWAVILLIYFTTDAAQALVFTVTVPANTQECYIAGSFTNWSHTKMTKTGTNTFSIDLEATASTAKYKYSSGPGWEYVEKSASGGEIADRSYNAADNVANWAALYNPGAQVGNITITATVPANTPDGEVYIVGSFVSPSWDPASAVKMTKTGSNTYRVTIENVTTIQYKLTCGLSWDYEELTASGGTVQDRTATSDNPNVSITVDQWKNIPGESRYTTHTFNNFSPLQGSRRILIWLPPDYDISPNTYYPVFYMHDGQNVFESGPYGSWNMESALLNLYNQGKPVGIVVTIDNSAGRMKEYAPFANANYAPNPEGDAYLQAIKDHVIPYVNANFRTLTDRENTGIGGSSLGGLISYYAGLKHEDTFGRIAPMSPSFWYNRNALASYTDNWTGQYTSGTKMYFICGSNEGDSDMVPDMQQFYNKIMSKGYTSSNIAYEVVSGGTHSEGAWAAQIGRVYQFLFEGNSPVTKTEKEMANDALQINKVDGKIYFKNQSNQVMDVQIFSSTGQQMGKLKLQQHATQSFKTTGFAIARWTMDGKEFVRKLQ